MKKGKLLVFAISSLLFVGVSCSPNSDQGPTPNPSPVTVTYTNAIKSIIDNNCTNCHGSVPSNGASIPLNTHLSVKVSADNVIDRISRAQGAGGMAPKNGPRLPQSTIDKIINWKNTSYPE